MARRTYNQYCATARTLDVVGERWTLLLIRELLTGPKRFGDLLESLHGLGTGLLAGRLKHLETEGLVRRITLPAPARTPAYELTEAGAELGPAVMALARWGMKWALGERRDGEEIRPGWALLAMQALFDADAARDVAAIYEFRIDGEAFHARIDRGTIETVQGPAQRADAVVEASADAFVELAAGRLSLADAIRAGTAGALTWPATPGSRAGVVRDDDRPRAGRASRKPARGGDGLHQRRGRRGRGAAVRRRQALGLRPRARPVRRRRVRQHRTRRLDPAEFDLHEGLAPE